MRFACKRVKLEEILNCSLGINRGEYRLFVLLMRAEKPLSVVECAKRLGRSVSAIQKSMLTLLKKGIVKRRQVNMAKGGYHYIYSISDKDYIKKTLKDNVLLWTDSIVGEIERL